MRPLEIYDRYQNEWSDIGLHLPWLRDHAKGKVLEIGVREGISTSALLLGVAHHGGHVWSVDIDNCDLDFDQDNKANWTFIQADSGKDCRKVLDSIGGEIDLLFLDGDHSYAGCMSDLTTYGPLAKVIAVHDTNSNFVGVWESVISYFRSNHVGCFSRAEFFNGSNGLGVLYR